MADYKAITMEFYELLLNDFDAAVARFIAEDFVWENPLPESIPFGGIYHGAVGLAEYLGGLMQAIEMNPLHFDEIIVEGGTVAAIGVERDTLVRTTGKRYNMPFVHVIRFSDEEKISHVREYNDIVEMLPAFTADQ